MLLFTGMALIFTLRLASERNMALAEVKRTTLVEHFLFNLFQGGDKSVGPAADLRVLTLVDRGAQEAKALGREPQLQAELYQALGQIYQELGKFDNALSFPNASLKEKDASGSNSGAVAESLLAIGLLRLD
jgi:hypothetical protein